MPEGIFRASCGQSIHHSSHLLEQLHSVVGQPYRFPAWLLPPLPGILTPKLYLCRSFDVLPLRNLPKTIQRFEVLLGHKDRHQWSLGVLYLPAHWRLLQLPATLTRCLICILCDLEYKISWLDLLHLRVVEV